MQVQARHLSNLILLDQFSAQYGEIRDKTVLYRGPDCVGEDGVAWRNVGSFLKETADSLPCVISESVCRPS